MFFEHPYVRSSGVGADGGDDVGDGVFFWSEKPLLRTPNMLKCAEQDRLKSEHGEGDGNRTAISA